MGRFLYQACAGCAFAYIMSIKKNCHKGKLLGSYLGILCAPVDEDISHLCMQYTNMHIRALPTTLKYFAKSSLILNLLP